MGALIYMKVQDGCEVDHYTINNEVADNVQESTVERILSYHSPEAIVDFFNDSKYTELL